MSSQKTFERELMKREKAKAKQLTSCREGRYIVLMIKIIACLAIYGLILLIFMYPLSVIMPIYKSDECLIMWYKYSKAKNTYNINKGMLTAQKLTFTIVNWLELVVLYKVWRNLKNCKQN